MTKMRVTITTDGRARVSGRFPTPDGDRLKVLSVEAPFGKDAAARGAFRAAVGNFVTEGRKLRSRADERGGGS